MTVQSRGTRSADKNSDSVRRVNRLFLPGLALPLDLPTTHKESGKDAIRNDDTGLSFEINSSSQHPALFLTVLFSTLQPFPPLLLNFGRSKW